MHKMIMASRYMLGASLIAMVTRMADDSEGLGIIELEQNLADVEKPPELPAGLYVGEIQDVQIGTSQKGNRYFNVKFVVPTDEIPAELADDFEDGAALFYNRVIVPNGKDRRALFNLRKFVEALGLDSNSTSIDPNDWMGRQARLRVTQEAYQGEMRAQIKSIESAEGKSAKPAERAAPTSRGGGRRK